MTTRQIGGGFLAAVAAIAGSLLQMTIPNPTAFMLIVIWSVVAVLFIAGLAMILFPKKETSREVAMGDNYNNFGDNFGHIGPLNIGRPRFEFTDSIAQQILDAVPKDHSIHVLIIGSNRSQEIGGKIVSFLENHGITVAKVYRHSNFAPPPSEPLSFNTGTHTLTVAADVS